ncbi:hypothetical protein [Winogradskyella endarachnes]|uniref:Uncharacterized protein n=1 Tax=Winogradskyella endarachnes TaxID=2681965 RepID=A0A6L6U4A2_9FLAO|nr:hypothetical protein [Winogradskyella endarachnes]MUU76883.1 hypothetical protein [Winogradskyella endarachnes]
MSLYNRFKITKKDLEKRSYGIHFSGLDDVFLEFLAQEKQKENPLLSDLYLATLVKKRNKQINSSIYTLSTLGIVCLVIGLYKFFYTEALVGVNLFTQFPLISNGAIEIAGSLFLLIGSYYSFVKRKDVLERLVKSDLIEALKKFKREKDILASAPSKKQKRFKKSFKVGKKKS